MRISLLLILCLPAVAQPASVSRVLRTFDFEERRLGNDEDLPMHWLKVEASGFPHYVNGRLTTDHVHGGHHSFRLDLNGGSLLYRLEANQIPVQTGATYHIEGYVQSTPMPHARARLTAYFTDADGHSLDDNVTQSEPYSSPDPDGEWKKISLTLTARSESAAFLVLEMGLLQPEFYAADRLGGNALFPQDIHGTAWFDDITVSQVPRVALFTDRPGNIYRSTDTPRLMMNVDDAFLVDLSTQLCIRDGNGAVVYQRTGAIDAVGAPPADGMRKRLELALPTLPPGWYNVTLSTSSQGMKLGSQDVAIVRLPDDGDVLQPDDRFGLIATDVPFQSWGQLPELVSHLGCGRVKLGVWSSKSDPEQLDPADFDGMIARFQSMHITPTACLLDLPASVIKSMDAASPNEIAPPRQSKPGGSWLRLLKSKNEQWQPSLEYLLARHAAHLDRWQLGADGSDVFATNKQMRDVYAKVYSRFLKLVPDPDLAMPWPAWYELDEQLPGTVALSIPSSVLPSQLPLYVQDVKGGKGHRLSLSLQLLDREKYGRDVQVRDLAQRVIYALTAGADRIDLPCPFTVGVDASFEQPQETFVAMRTLLTTLSHTTYRGRVPIAEGVECFLFDREGEGVLVLWDTGRTGGVKTLAINLGDSPRMFDLWGNDIPLLRPQGDVATSTVRLSVSTMPTFLTNIDGYLAKLRATVAIDRPLIESSYEGHTRHVRFTNTYPVSVTGTLHLQAPKGWTISPATHNFSLNPGEAFDQEIQIEFPYNSPAGPQTIEAQFAMQARTPVAFQLPLSIKLGLAEVSMQTMAFRDGQDEVVQIVVQNYSDKSIDYTAFALMPGQQRQERLVTSLAAGKSTIRKFRFDATRIEPGTSVRVGLKELDGPRILNDEVRVK